MTGPDTQEATVEGLVGPEGATALAAVLDLAENPAAGGELPPLWHLAHLLPEPLQQDLGPDGHARHGIPNPPGPGRRRMFAGGRITTFGPLLVGRSATRRTRVIRSVEKAGRSGPLTFVTVGVEIHQDGRLVVDEEQDIVYRAAGSGSLPRASELPERVAGVDASDGLGIDVDEALLFRFSALTHNAHRIHYDRQWARREGYADLVVHGPLQVLLMAEHLRRRGTDLVGRRLSYRLVAPLIGPQRVRALSGSGDPEETRAPLESAHVLAADGTRTAVAAVEEPGPRGDTNPPSRGVSTT